jgi:putative transposase
MPQEVGVEYPGAVYHVTSRGDQREDIFLEDVGRRRFAPRPRVPIQFRIR